MTIQTHDFSRPPSLRPEARANLAEWLTRSNVLLAEVIAGLAVKVEIQLEDSVTAWPTIALQEWSENAIAFRVQLADVIPASILAIPNPLAQVLIGAMMGETGDEWPSERDLTPAELSVAEVFFSNITSTLIEGWTSDAALDLRIIDRELNLRKTKVFKFREPLIVCRSTIGTPLGSAQWCWMMPHDFLTRLFGSPRAAESVANGSSRQQLESMARDMSTQLSIRLGKVQLSAVQLSELQVGDLVVLNQKTTEPLKAMVSGKPRFLGWPGRVGNRQAFEIVSDTSRHHRTVTSANSVSTAAGR